MPKFCGDKKKFFFLTFVRDKPLWGELKLFGRENIYYYNFISLETTNTQWSVSFKNFFRKSECIRNCNLLISSNFLQESFRKTSFFVLFYLLPKGLSMHYFLLPHSINGLMILFLLQGHYWKSKWSLYKLSF